MKCKEIQYILPIYGDDVLSAEERKKIAGHVSSCPLCRQALEDYRHLRTDSQAIKRIEMPAALSVSIKSALSAHLDRPVITIATESTQSFNEKLMHWLMPYSVGTVAASLFILVFLFVMMSDLQSSVTILQARSQDDSSLLLANANTDEIGEDLYLPRQYGGVVLATTPPELNPAGALVALTKSIVRGNMKDEEVVVVADVFGNGLARIAEVVDPPGNERAMRELQRAFETDPEKAPFKPSKFEKDIDRVRVVLRINRVDVSDKPL